MIEVEVSGLVMIPLFHECTQLAQNTPSIPALSQERRRVRVDLYSKGR